MPYTYQFLCVKANSHLTALKRKRTLSQWLNDFVEADYAYNAEQYEADDWDHRTDPMPGAADDFFDEEIDDGLIEMLVIIGLVGALALLIYYRQQRQLAERRRLEQQQQQQADGQPQQPPQPQRGFFPPPNDPDFANWVAGGIGH